MSDLKDCQYVSYADDSYVVNSGKDITEALEVTRNNIVSHTNKLTQMGMVVNQSKTEIMVMTRSGNITERRLTTRSLFGVSQR